VSRPPAAIAITDLRKRFGDTVALDGLTLTAGTGRITGILGPNGAGKTTALEICVGLTRPDSGRVEVLGSEPWRSGPGDRARVGMMLQRGGVWSSATARQAIGHVARFYATPLPTDYLLERMQLGSLGRTAFRRMSGGEQQRVKLACAIVGRPSLVILDEPTAGLDPTMRLAVWELIGQLRREGASVVLSTHSMQEAERLADHLVIVNKGVCVASGSPADLTADPHGRTLRFTATAHLDRSALLRALPIGFELAEEAPGEYRLTGASIAPATIAAVTAWCAERGVLASELNLQQRDLEQVFLDVTSQGQVAP
jgi:ABC-2 type transport system ATP-binding protein